MKIAIDARPLGPTETGPGVYTREILIRVADTLSDTEFHLFVADEGVVGSLPKAPNLYPHVLGRPGGRKLGNLVFEQLLLPAALYRVGCDLLWSPAFVLPLWKRTAQIVTIHDLIPILQAGEFSRIRRLVYNPLLRINARQADRIVTVSQSSAADIAQHLSVDPDQIDAIHNGVDTAFRPLRQEDAGQLRDLLDRLSIRAPYAISTAGLLPRKNALRVIRAFAGLHQRIGSKAPSTLVFTGRLDAAGDDRYGSVLREEAVRVDIAPKLAFPGHLSREDLRLLYAGALWSVYVSLYEGFGFPIIESMAGGCPVITSNRSSMPEVAGNAALVIDPMSDEEITAAMERITLDELLRQTLRRRGLERSSWFTWESSADQHIAAFEKALGHSLVSAEVAA